MSNKETYTDQEKYKSIYNSTICVLTDGLNIKMESDDNHYVDAA